MDNGRCFESILIPSGFHIVARFASEEKTSNYLVQGCEHKISKIIRLVNELDTIIFPRSIGKYLPEEQNKNWTSSLGRKYLGT